MENPVPGPSKGYQKQIKKEAPKINPEKKVNIDYSSPTAKKWPLLLEALESGNVERVKKYIEEGMNVTISRNGVTPLMIAASHGHRETAAVLIQTGVNVNERTDDGWTALHKAAFDQVETGIVELLMESGVVIEARNKAGKTALQLAEEKGHRDIALSIKKHLEHTRDDAREWEDFLHTPEGKPYRVKRQHESLAQYAKLLWLPPLALGGIGLLFGLVFGVVVSAGIIGAVSGLLVVAFFFAYERMTSSYLEKYEPLPPLNIHILREKKDAGEQITLEEKHAGYDHPEALPGNKRILQIAATAAVVLIVLLLIGSILWINRDTLSKWYYVTKVEKTGVIFSDGAFLNEVSKNNEKVVELFLKAGVNPAVVNEKGQTALMIAAEKGYVNILARLIGPSAATFNQADKSGNTALMLAARHGQEPAVQTLIQNGVDVNYTAPSNTGAASALQAALDVPEFKTEHMSVLNYLLQHGADVKGRNKTGQSPLLFAAEHGHDNAAKVLIEHGADVNDADLNGINALFTSACRGYSGFVSLLVGHGVNIRSALPDGRTPLMCSVQEGHLDTALVLLEKGAPVNARNSSGGTALSDAARTGDVTAVHLLLAQGADPGSVNIPDSFMSFKGRIVAVNARKSKLSDVLKSIANPASQDGYTINYISTKEQVITFKSKGSWNKVLHELARRNNIVLVLKDKKLDVMTYDPAAIKRDAI